MSKKSDKEIEDLREEIAMLDTMLNSLVDVLEEKGLLGHQEWEQKIKKHLGSK